MEVSLPRLFQQGSALINTARRAYHLVRGCYRQTRALQNRFANLIDCPLIILIYHRVTLLNNDPEMIAVTPENFRRQLEYLKQHHPVLGFTDNWSALQEPSVVITFDDGYADNVQQALPILEELQVPATFFVSSGYLDSDRLFWWDRLERCLLHEGEYPDQFVLNDARYGGCWQTKTLEQRQDLYRRLSFLLRKFDSERQVNWLAQLEEWSKPPQPDDDPHRQMTTQELKTLVGSPWATVGAHTVEHVALSALPETRQREEIFSSKQQLEELSGARISCFSYPFGRKVEYDRTSVRLCREAGFDRVASNFPGQVHRWTDPFQLPRHLVRNWDQPTFATELKRFWSR